jgi:2-deoxy-D-gluconate 3-dehydrogenase
MESAAMPNEMFGLEGRVAIVTGGNAGIGLGIAKGLGRAGAPVVVAARDQAKTAKAAEDLQALDVPTTGLAVDVRDEASVRAMVKSTVDAFGRVDILVNNAGIAVRSAPQDCTLAEWDQVVSVNLTGMFLCSREAHPHMRKSGGGKIINIGSMFSIFGSDLGASYAASKGGVVQLTKSLAVAWAKDNIQGNAILPGWIHTDLTAPSRTSQSATTPSRLASPTGGGENRTRSPARPCFSRAASDYVTGVSLAVDRGYRSK